MIDRIIMLLAGVIAVIFVFSPHEYAHALIAYKCGDPTAAVRGRKTLNPFKHIDPAGFILCAVVGFGWAKPVPVDPYNFKNYRRGMFLTAIAGVVTNYIIAFVDYLLLMLAARFLMPLMSGHIILVYLGEFIYMTLYLIYLYSLYSVTFNLLPLFPLDGFRVVEAFTREINPVRKFLRNYGQVILIILIVESFACGIVVDYVPDYNVARIVNYCDILGYLGWFSRNILGFPIQAAWGWILRV